MTFYFLLIFSLYFITLVALRVGWKRGVRQDGSDVTQTNLFVTVIVPVRNEEATVETLLVSLFKQEYSPSNFEVIFVDDHSTDNTEQVIKNMIGFFFNFQFIQLAENETGKKAALTKGIKAARGQVIATTDADCKLPVSWLKNVNDQFDKLNIKMAVGMVSISAGNDFFVAWQAMEFASVIGTGVATIGLGMPTMCNGANLSFRKQTFEEVNGYQGNEHLASGDDEFLMRKILEKYPASIKVMSHSNSIVTTPPQVSVRDFIRQRIRWASKWKTNTSYVSKVLAILIFLFQLSWISLVLALFFGHSKLFIGSMLLVKLAADFVFLLPIFKFFKIKFQLLPFVGLQLLYPFYVIFIGIFSQWKNVKWKDRPIA